MTMSAKATKIMERYMKNYVTDAQLAKYLALGVITQDEYDYIYATKHPAIENEDNESDVIDIENDAEA